MAYPPKKKTPLFFYILYIKKCSLFFQQKKNRDPKQEDFKKGLNRDFRSLYLYTWYDDSEVSSHPKLSSSIPASRFFFLRIHKEQIYTTTKWCIYRIYGVFSFYIQQYRPSTSAFFRPRPSASDEKMPRFRDYTVGYSPQTHRISITYIYIYYIYLPILSR